ncbi:unknown [[Mannheimia] succiniciproducens MBEL55E]|uniref:Uncharacterized protein n=1 Tax=Mannheimia succiniciproducens (strain KCTC 0769BP / MBEL55E) TaxID=221988 RepID=Q65S10_MANSM|nr:unknown [[Mannheimia] succiniciproducens MBEL55E]
MELVASDGEGIYHCSATNLLRHFFTFFSVSFFLKSIFDFKGIRI